MNDAHNDYSVLDQYPILQIAQFFPVLFAYPSIFFVFTYLNRIALHINCRVLMFAWIGAFIVMVSINLSMAIFDLCAGHYNPHKISETEWGPYLYTAHGMTHAFSSVQELLIAVERAVACYRPGKYHNNRFCRPLFIIVEGIALAWTYCYMLIIQTDNFFYIGASSNIVDTSALLCMIFGSLFIRRMKRVQHDTLNAKYQLKEASTVSRIILVIGVVSLFSKMSAMIWVWLYVMDFAPFSIITTSAVMMHTVNCGIVGYLFIRMHQGLNKRAAIFRRWLFPKRKIEPAAEVLTCVVKSKLTKQPSCCVSAGSMRYVDGQARRRRQSDGAAETRIHFIELARYWDR
uniref:Uncharacterized protein n=1 Tax=Pristionchus pacificus TaxID=54126 RepID=A0A2A6CQD6_PRIPA|eukprot:PDM80425.1 hypothetical protein PRIPAC_33004 [Pristionchus pacificus]